MPGPLTTNICFGRPDLGMACVTLSGLGKHRLFNAAQR
jgi:hypothetical protein